jgi:hypothetical protein
MAGGQAASLWAAEKIIFEELNSYKSSTYCAILRKRLLFVAMQDCAVSKLGA